VTQGTELVTRDFTAGNVAGLSLTSATYLSDDWFDGSGYRDKFLTAWGTK
jgi:hypothetical protein